MPDTVHIDAALSEFAIRKNNEPGAFIAERVAPRVPVPKQSDKYYEWDTNHLRRVETLRKKGTPPNEIDYELSDSSFYCEDHELMKGRPFEDPANADPAINPEEDDVQFLLDAINLDREYRVAAILTDNTLITNTTDLTAVAANRNWDEANSTPFTDITTAKNSVIANALRPANTIVIPYAVAMALKQHDDYIERYKYTGNPMTASGIMPVLEGLTVVEAGLHYNTAQEGQTDVLAALWGKSVLIGYVPPGRPTKETPAGIVTFEWSRFPRAVRRWTEEKPKKNCIAYSDGYTDEVLTGAGFWYLFTNVIN